jgi:hypothetical protein
MSFNIPRNLPDFNAGQRRYEDAYWSSSGTSHREPAVQRKTVSFALRGPNNKDLPMYKDKPYNYGYPDARTRSWKKIIMGMAAFVAACYVLHSFWFRSSSSSSSSAYSGSRSRGKSKGERYWSKRSEDVVKAMEKSWAGYEKHAWGMFSLIPHPTNKSKPPFWLTFILLPGFDEYHPVSKAGRMMVPPTGLGWIIVDALDTLMLMNLTSQLRHAREWISTTLTYELDHDVNTFETTIRMLGGFLSAHYLQTAFPLMTPTDMVKGGEDLYLEKATDLAERILGAFNSPSGIPYSSVNLKTTKGLPSHADGGAASLAEATSVQLEFKYLANLTGEVNFWSKVEKVMQVIDETGEKDGLKGIYVQPDTGRSSSHNIRLGSRGDSYYGSFNH